MITKKSRKISSKKITKKNKTNKKNNARKISSKPLINPRQIKSCLKAEKSRIFKLNFSNEQLECFKQFNITHNNAYSFYGSYDSIDPISFLGSIGNNSSSAIELISNTIKRLARDVCDGYNLKHCWLAIRTHAKADNSFDIPRWHIDGVYFLPTPGEPMQLQSKFIMVLQGNGTLYINATQREKAKYYNILREQTPKTLDDVKAFFNNKKLQMELREKKNAVFARYKMNNGNNGNNTGIKQLQIGEGLIFIAGHHKNALVHSEPPITGPRLFISILPGTEQQIMSLQKKTIL